MATTQTPNPAQIIRDPDFLALSPADKITFLNRADADFAGLSDSDKLSFVSRLSASQQQQPGFLGRYSQQMIGTAHPIQAAERIGSELVNNPIETLKAGASDAVNDAEALGKAVVTHPLDTAGTLASSVIGIPQLKQDIGSGNWAGAAGTAAADLTPAVLSKVSDALRAVKAGASVADALGAGRGSLDMGELGGKFPVSVGNLRGGMAQGAENALRDIPIAGKPLQNLAAKQGQFVINFSGTLPQRAEQARQAAGVLYGNIQDLDNIHGLTGPNSFTSLLSQRQQLNRLATALRRSDREAEALPIIDQVKAIDGRITDNLNTLDRPDMVDQYGQAKKLWRKSNAIGDVQNVLDKWTRGLLPEQQTLGQAVKPQELRGAGLLENLKKLQDVPGHGDQLTAALGPKGSSELLQAADLVARNQQSGRFVYRLEQLGSVAAGAAIGDHPSFLKGIAPAAIGGYAISKALSSPGGAAVVAGFLKAGTSPQALAVYAPRILKAAGVIKSDSQVNVDHAINATKYAKSQKLFRAKLHAMVNQPQPMMSTGQSAPTPMPGAQGFTPSQVLLDQMTGTPQQQ